MKLRRSDLTAQISEVLFLGVFAVGGFAVVPAFTLIGPTLGFPHGVPSYWLISLFALSILPFFLAHLLSSHAAAIFPLMIGEGLFAFVAMALWTRSVIEMSAPPTSFPIANSAAILLLICLLVLLNNRDRFGQILTWMLGGTCLILWIA